MAKINPIFGKFQGKLGGTVFAIRNGEQILREYNPSPSNPSTVGQVEARAKLKLMSQLAAVMAPVISIPSVGAVSSRNLFVKNNYKYASYSNETAEVSLTSVQLTKSVLGLPTIDAVRQQNDVAVSLASNTVTVDRVVYVCFLKGADDKLRYFDSKTVSDPGVSGRFESAFNIVSRLPILIYAYGIRDNSQSARVLFGDLVAPTAETIAKLVTSRVLTEQDITLTETQAVELPTVE